MKSIFNKCKYLLMLNFLLFSGCNETKLINQLNKSVETLPKINNQFSCTPNDAFYVKNHFYFYCQSSVQKNSLERSELRSLVENHIKDMAKKNEQENLVVFVYFTDERTASLSKK